MIPTKFDCWKKNKLENCPLIECTSPTGRLNWCWGCVIRFRHHVVKVQFLLPSYVSWGAVHKRKKISPKEYFLCWQKKNFFLSALKLSYISSQIIFMAYASNLFDTLSVIDWIWLGNSFTNLGTGHEFTLILTFLFYFFFPPGIFWWASGRP